jgi:hypothetical protein
MATVITLKARVWCFHTTPVDFVVMFPQVGIRQRETWRIRVQGNRRCAAPCTIAAFSI